MDKLYGVIAGFDHAIVLNRDTRFFGYLREDLIELTVRHGFLNLMELAIGGYNEDSRALYEFPEVRRWVKLVHAAYPDSFLWMTPGSMWVWVLSLHPGMVTTLPDGRNQIQMDTDAIIPELAASLIAGEELLAERGMTEEQIARVRAQVHLNFTGMLQRKKPGEDYQLLNADGGPTAWYKRD